MQCPFCKEEIADGAIKCKHCNSILNANVKILPYQTYQQVPWYRKNWFTILTGIFFPPALLLVLLSGDVYYVRKQQLTTYGGFAKFFLILLCLPSMALLVLIFGGTLLIGGAALTAARDSVEYFEKHPDKMEIVSKRCQETHKEYIGLPAMAILGRLQLLPNSSEIRTATVHALREMGLPGDCANAFAAAVITEAARKKGVDQPSANTAASSPMTPNVQSPTAPVVASTEPQQAITPQPPSQVEDKVPDGGGVKDPNFNKEPVATSADAEKQGVAAALVSEQFIVPAGSRERH